MVLTKDFYRYLKKLENSNPLGLRAYGYDSPEVLELRRLAIGSESNSKKNKKYQRVSPKITGDYQLPWNYVNVKRVNELRRERNIPLYQMAKLVGMSTTQYHRIEKGLVRMRESRLNLIARVLRVERKELLTKKKFVTSDSP